MMIFMHVLGNLPLIALYNVAPFNPTVGNESHHLPCHARERRSHHRADSAPRDALPLRRCVEITREAGVTSTMFPDRKTKLNKFRQFLRRT
jgi:hypothetical protein